jgi:hypothetical protein
MQPTNNTQNQRFYGTKRTKTPKIELFSTALKVVPPFFRAFLVLGT